MLGSAAAEAVFDNTAGVAAWAEPDALCVGSSDVLYNNAAQKHRNMSCEKNALLVALSKHRIGPRALWYSCDFPSNTPLGARARNRLKVKC